MKRLLISTLLLCLGLLISQTVEAQRPGGRPGAAKAAAADGDKAKPGDAKKKKGKTFEDVITEDAITDEGLFHIHKVKDKYYFEIPNDLMDKDILVVSRIAGHVRNLNFGGAGMKSRPEQIIRWIKHDEKVLMKAITYDVVADDSDAIAKSVKNNNVDPIIQSFKIATYNKDSSGVVVDMTSFFTSDIPMFGPFRGTFDRRKFGIKGLDKSRSVIDSIKSYPKNVEIRHSLTYRGDKLPDNNVTQSITIGMNQSYILLPENPWKPRIDDARVDYFDIDRTNYSLNEHKAARETFITRWRLEPKDPAAYFRGELVEPKNPIVYYLDPGTPMKWRKYLKQGVEDWQVAFEAAGFKNAIIAKDPPTKEEDPEWSPEDVRYSVIRYVATDIQNAQGPHVHDPRTGEILESDIIWYHNVMNLLRNWYFIQTSAVNPNAKKVKFTDELMGELIRFVAAHEVGHTIGLPHNMGSSSAYHVDSLRTPGFVSRMGVAPSIMDYARFNYVAQPEDNLPEADLFPKVGPYDIWSIMYGYKLIDGSKTAYEEKKTLNKWILERADDPIYRFGQQQRGVVDPSGQTEAVGSDAVAASDLGIKNLKRITKDLVETASIKGKNYSDLAELMVNVAGQFRRYMGHVGNHIGGQYEFDKTGDQEGAVYAFVSKEDQRAAMNFLNRQLFTTPKWMYEKAIIDRTSLDINGVVRGLQSGTLNTLFRSNRMERMALDESINGSNAYTMSDLFDDTRRMIFVELTSGADIESNRRVLQRLYIDKMGDLIMSTSTSMESSDAKALARATLSRIKEDLEKMTKRATGMNKGHAMDLIARIEMIEEGKVSAPAAPRNPFALEDDTELGCWEDDLSWIEK